MIFSLVILVFLDFERNRKLSFISFYPQKKFGPTFLYKKQVRRRMCFFITMFFDFLSNRKTREPHEFVKSLYPSVGVYIYALAI
jgi:hypothetical protein